MMNEQQNPNNAQRRRKLETEMYPVEDSNKKIRQHEASGNDDGSMEVDSNLPAAAATKSNPDEILVQMVQDGAHSQVEVIDFCILSGIPLSRALRLDLLRLNTSRHDNQSNQTQNNNNMN